MLLQTLKAEFWKITTAVALALAAFQTVRIEGFLFIDGFKDDIASLEADQRKAREKSKDVEVQNKEVALTHGDTNYAHKVAKARDVVYRYVADHRVQPSGSCSRPTEDGPAPSDNLPGADTEYVAVSRNDFEIFVENSLKMQAVHEWGQELIKRDLAVPAPEFGSPPEELDPSPAAVEP